MRRLHRLVLIAVAILASAPSSSAQMDDIPCLIPRTIPDPSGPGSGGAPLGPGVQYAKRAPTRHAAERAAKPESAEEGSKATVEMEIPKVTECKPYFQLHFTEWVGHFNEYDGVSTMPVDVAVQSVGLSHVGETWRWGVTLPYVNW